MAKPVLAYWNIRGLAEPIRLLLHYAGVQFDDVHYTPGPAPDYECEKWKNDKFSMGFHFPNIPYYIDGDVKLTQSNAILRYLARKFDLIAKSEEDRMLMDMVENEAMDFRVRFGFLCYDPEFESKKDAYIEDLPVHLRQYEAILQNNQFFVKNKLTFPDFIMYELLDVHLELVPNMLDGFPKLKDFHRRIQELPGIKEYLTSPSYKRLPSNYITALFGASV